MKSTRNIFQNKYMKCTFPVQLKYCQHTNKNNLKYLHTNITLSFSINGHKLRIFYGLHFHSDMPLYDYDSRFFSKMSNWKCPGSAIIILNMFYTFYSVNSEIYLLLMLSNDQKITIFLIFNLRFYFF